MSDAKHTPGPWFVGGGGRVRSKPVYAAGYADYICQMPYSSKSEAAEMPGAVADANLIASAPLLLGALKEVEGWLSAEGNQIQIGTNEAVDPWSLLDMIRDTIAKAEGR